MKALGGVAIGLNVVAFILIGILWGNNSGGNNSAESTDTDSSSMILDVEDSLENAIPSVDMKIAYVNLDSVVQNFELHVQNMKKYEGNVMATQKKLQQEEQAIQNEAVEFQNKAQRGLLLEEEMQTQGAAIQQKMVELQTKAQNKAQQWAKREQKLMEDLMVSLKAISNEYAKEQGYDLVISSSYQGIGTVMYGDPKFDVTKAIIDLLNKNYPKK